jgi:hypothetical protein
MWILSGSGTYSLSIGAAPLSTVWSWGMIRGVGCETPCREGRAIAVRDAKIQKQTHFVIATRTELTKRSQIIEENRGLSREHQDRGKSCRSQQPHRTKRKNKPT